MSIVILILLCSFFLLYIYSLTSYQNKIIHANISRNQLQIFELITPFINKEQRLANLLIVGNRSAWLHLAKIYAQQNSDIAYQLAQYYFSQGEKKSALVWYQQAIRQHHKIARIALAKHYFDTQQYQKIKALLLPIIDNEKALVMLYQLAIQLGDTAFISQHQATLANSTETDFYNQLVDFSVFNLHEKNNVNSINKTTAQVKSALEQCGVDVQFFATNLAGFHHGKKLIAQFQQHELSKKLCLQNPKYIPAHQVNCQHNKQDRITCKASIWATRNDINSRYIGLIVEQGGANVDHGIMYIDQQDNLDVLVHELAHFIGFIDEYPLPEQHQKCAKNQIAPFSHNVVTLKKIHHGERAKIRKRILAQLPWGSLIKDSTPILSKIKSTSELKLTESWVLNTPKFYQNELGVYNAHSCDKSPNVQAFKSHYTRTKLEYFELNFPQEYIKIMDLAPNKFLMPSYHFNVSRELSR